MHRTVVLIALLLTACTGESDGQTTGTSATTASSTHPTDAGAAASPTVPAPSAACPVTLPNGHNPPRQREPGQASPLSHGNGRLWVELYPRGIIGPANYGHARPNGAIWVKFPWTRGATGDLTITGRRLDADAAAARSRIPEGYGLTGFQSTAVIFPTPGCWEVTGRVGAASLTFITKVTGPSPP